MVDEDSPFERGRVAHAVAAIDDRWPGLRRRAGGVSLALLLEAGLILLLLTLGRGIVGNQEAADALTTVDFSPEPPPASEPDEQAEAQPRALPPVARPEPQPDVPTPPVPVAPPPPPAAVLSPRTEPAPSAPKIRAVVRSQDSGPAGPPNRGIPGDSERVGTMANGEPLYAARWYREPYPEELRGYLSTASGPGWALINCRTVAGFKIEDCELVDEWPNGSQMGRAVLAAAWQFKVRPPQVGGRPLVGSWVRIRITYDLKRG